MGLLAFIIAVMALAIVARKEQKRRERERPPNETVKLILAILDAMRKISERESRDRLKRRKY